MHHYCNRTKFDGWNVQNNKTVKRKGYYIFAAENSAFTGNKPLISLWLIRWKIGRSHAGIWHNNQFIIKGQQCHSSQRVSEN
jgi:hypothetical protein